MKLLFDIFPVLLFFVAYKVADIYVATGVAIGAALIQAGWTRLRTGRVGRMQLVSLGLLLLLGGVTLLLRDETFIKIKPTAVNWLFALIFLATHWPGQRTAAERLMGGMIQAPAPVWRRLNLSWTGFFTLAGALNLLVAYRFPTEVWVNFKLFGLVGLTLLFAAAQAVYLARHAQPVTDGD